MVLTALAVGVIVIYLFVSLGRAIFGGDKSTGQDPQADLTTNAADMSVEMKIRGPIVADEEFKTYVIQVSQTKRTLVIYKGYLQSQIIDSIELTNNIKAYDEFIHALAAVGMMKGTSSDTGFQGICATGKLYEFSVLSSGRAKKSLWTSTCKGSKGNLTASASSLQDLFIKQLPGAEKLIK